MPTTRSRKSCRTTGFSLTELSIALVLIGLSAGIYMKVNTASNAADCVIATKAQLETINQSITRYVNDKERYPLPAKRHVGVSSNEYGREVTAVTDAGIDRYNAGGKDVVIGALPFQELGLSPSYAGDCWGNKFTYFVTSSLTDSTKFTSAQPNTVYDGEIEVASDNVTTDPALRNAAYAVISHGPNGSGNQFVVVNNYTGPTSNTATNVTTLESGNYDKSDARVISAPQNASSFDDVVLYSGKKLVSVDGACGSASDPGGIPVPIAPANNLCASGTPTPVVPGADFTWSCKGVYGGSTDTTCSVPKSGGGGAPCNLPWGGSLADGQSITAYNTTSSPNCAANSAILSCTNGTLTGGDPSYQYQNCSAPSGCAAGSQTFSWSQGGFQCTGKTNVAIAEGDTGFAVKQHNHISPGFSGGNEGDLPVRCVNGVLQANGSGSCFGQCYANCGLTIQVGQTSCVPTVSDGSKRRIRCSLDNGVARATSLGSCGIDKVICQ